MNFVVEIANMLLGGLAAGMVLFIVSVGLSVTMGLMGFVNLAHGGFAMIGGYIIVLVMRHWGVGFIPALAIGFVITAVLYLVIGAVTIIAAKNRLAKQGIVPKRTAAELKRDKEWVKERM